MSRLVQQLIALLEALRRHGIRHAAIGGLAVVAHGIVRATQDLDFLVEAGARAELDRVMLELGFRSIHASADALNYVSDDCRIDFLLARRGPTRELLERARTLRVFGHELAVVDVEGIIGLKLQALVNDPRRQQDLVDMRGLLAAHHGSIDLERLRGYFALSDARRCWRICSGRWHVKRDDTRRAAPFAASAGVDTRHAVRVRDPFEVFDELMELVEGLLPGPPPPRPVGPTGRLLL